MRHFKLLAFVLACVPAFFACQDPQLDEVTPYVKIDKTQIEAPYTGLQTTLNLETNSKWTLTRTDADGNPVEWVKFDKLSGSNSVELSVGVMENTTKDERKAFITFEVGTEKAFLEVVQAGNPDAVEEPEQPEPEVPAVKKVLTFDFTVVPMEGWPLKQGAADGNLNKTVVYNLDGVAYNFIILEAPGSKGEKIFWRHDGDGVKDYFALAAPYRYLGLPMIEGHAIESVTITLGNKQPSEAYITNAVQEIVYTDGKVDAVLSHPAPISDVESLDLPTGSTVTFEVGSQSPSTQYYLYCKTLNTICSFVEITYVQVDGDIPDEPKQPSDPTPENPEPEQPENPEPEQPEDPEPEQPAIPSDWKVLTFDFTTEPQEGWPTAVPTGSTNNLNKTVVYNLDGVAYDFILMEAPGSKGEKVHWQYSDEKKYFVLDAQYRYLGLPLVEGYALQVVTCTVGNQVSGTASYVTSEIGGITADTHPRTDTAAQSWNVPAGTEIVYEVNATDATTQWYLYCKARNCAVSHIKLAYKPL